jgi:hypothetical protein
LVDKRIIEEGNADHFILFIAGAINETEAIIRPKGATKISRPRRQILATRYQVASIHFA